MDEIREQLARLEHEQWAHWTAHMLDHLTPENIARWRQQIATPYEQLTELEKQSDRQWADKVLAIVNAQFNPGWSSDLPVRQVRVARPTDQLERVVEFYRDGIGLAVIGSFAEHAGYNGVMLGLPGNRYHLEFTQHTDGSPCPAPTRDNLLVFYFMESIAIQKLVTRLDSMGYPAVPPENPYWEPNGVTIEDPDGWRVVLFAPEVKVQV